MKAVVLEIRGKKAALLCDDGSVIRVNNKGYEAGQRLILPQQPNTIKVAFNMLCAAAVFFLCTLGIYAYITPYAYVSIDVNPSVEFVLNRFDRVLSVNGVNDDGKDISERIAAFGVRNRSINDAVKFTVDQLWQQEYFSEEGDNFLLLAASSDSEQKAIQLTETIERSLSDKAYNRGIIVRSLRVTPQQVSQAQRLGITPGKLGIISELATLDADPETFKAEEWLNKPVKEVVKAINENKRAGKGNNHSSGRNDNGTSPQFNNGKNGEENSNPLNQKPQANDKKNAEDKATPSNNPKQSENNGNKPDQEMNNPQKAKGSEKPQSGTKENKPVKPPKQSNGNKNNEAGGNSQKNKDAKALEANMVELEQFGED